MPFLMISQMKHSIFYLIISFLLLFLFLLFLFFLWFEVAYLNTVTSLSFINIIPPFPSIVLTCTHHIVLQLLIVCTFPLFPLFPLFPRLLSPHYSSPFLLLFFPSFYSIKLCTLHTDALLINQFKYLQKYVIFHIKWVDLYLFFFSLFFLFIYSFLFFSSFS